MSSGLHLQPTSTDAAGPINPLTTLGPTGLRLNPLALAVGPYEEAADEERFSEIVSTFMEAGGLTFDISGDDAGFAQRAMASQLSGVLPRDEVVLIGRSGRHVVPRAVPGVDGDSSRRGLTSHLDASLDRLGTDHFDLWLVDGLDTRTPVAEVAATMAWAVETGRASYVGVARCEAWQAVDLAHHLRDRNVPLAAHSVRYSLLDRKAEGAPRQAATSLAYGLMTAMPLAGGALSGKYRHQTPSDSRLRSLQAATVSRYLDQRSRGVIESLATAADGLGIHPSELALAWVLQGATSDVVTLGVRTPAQLKVCLRALELNLPAQIVTVLDEVSQV